MSSPLLNLNQNFVHEFWRVNHPELFRKIQLIESKELWVKDSHLENVVPKFLNYLFTADEELWCTAKTMQHIVTVTNYLSMSRALYLFLWMDSVSPRHFASILINAQVHSVLTENSYTLLLRERIDIMYQDGHLENLFSLITYGCIMRLAGDM